MFRSYQFQIIIIIVITSQVLDLHNNDFSELPEDICDLSHLQVLNIEGNKLKKLPKGLGRLQALQTLNTRSKSSVR